MFLHQTWKFSNFSIYYSKIILRSLSTGNTTVTDPKLKFPGCKTSFTTELSFTNNDTFGSIPIYRVLHYNGEVMKKAEDPQLSKETLLKMYERMILLKYVDKHLAECHRKKRIAYYIENTGEEGVQIGSAAALLNEDIIYTQYRECGVYLWRGVSVDRLMNQCFANCDDISKGRQMTLHYSDKSTNMVPISSTLGTKIPQAAGTAYALKSLGNNKRCTICYFGEGSSSEGDVHAGFNFAATLGCPVVYICRNNGYSMSTPTHQQYRGDGIAGRGPGYGMDTIRVDGTDVLAVYNAIKKAREYAISLNKPVLIETMTYRLSDHSTSTDNRVYRDESEGDIWRVSENPVRKFRLYLELKGYWNQDMEDECNIENDKTVLQMLEIAENKKKPNWRECFTDVYHTMPCHIRKQMDEMEEHLRKYGDNYSLLKYKS